MTTGHAMELANTLNRQVSSILSGNLNLFGHPVRQDRGAQVRVSETNYSVQLRDQMWRVKGKELPKGRETDSKSLARPRVPVRIECPARGVCVRVVRKPRNQAGVIAKPAWGKLGD